MSSPTRFGKTMLARRLITILPEMGLDEAIETINRPHLPNRPLVAARPFRNPHCTISDAGLIGGGVNPIP